MNAYIALYRRNSVLRDWPILEVIGVAAITAAVSYLVSVPFLFQFYFYNWFSLGRLLTVSVNRWYTISESNNLQRANVRACRKLIPRM